MTRTVPLKRLARIRYGLGQPPPTSDEGVPILRATNISRGKISSDNLMRAHLSDLPLDRAPLLVEGEILVVRSGAYTGDSARVPREWAGSAPGYDLRVTPHSADSRYLAYSLLGDAAHDRMILVSTRAAQPHLNAEELGEVGVWQPSVEDQRGIADFLDAETARIDKLSALQRSAMHKLDERESAQLDLEIDELVERHGVVPLRRFLLGVDQGASPQCDVVPAADGEWGVLKVSSLRPGLFNPAENKRLPAEVEPDQASEVREGDLLVVRANTPQLVGSTAVVPQVRRKLLLSDKIFRVRLDGRLAANFVATVARGRRIRTLCAAGSNGASQSMANIRFEEVKAWPIPAASLDMQAGFVARVADGRAALDRLRPRIERQLVLLAERRQALITAAVTGQFDVSTASGRNVTEGITA
ncbi:type I restriction enzyme S subunit [Streptomyces sp. CG 926]|nr:type I restriction enzyme S subunit [Streptomyces sp. CG 926]